VAKLGDHLLRRLASSHSNVIRQAGRQADKNSSLGDFFKNSVFGIWLLFSGLNAIIFSFGSAKTIP